MTPINEAFPFCRREGFQAVIFDWDGVIVDSCQASGEAYQRILRDLGVEIDQREIRLREGEPTRELITSLLSQRGASVTQDKLDTMVEHRREYDLGSGQRKFFPSIWDLIRRIQASGLRTAVVTGSSRASLNRFLGPDLASALNTVVSADDVVRSKPNPEPFLLAAEGLGYAPEQCLVVENAPFGIRAALQAGCRVVGLCTTLAPDDLQEAHWIVRDHPGLERLLSSSTDLGTVGS